MKLGLNVGSGQRPFTSTPEVQWINVDKVARDGYVVDVLCDGAHLPCVSGSVDYFVLSHCCEHFGCGEAVDLIHEAHRVLKRTGSLIVAVPNMQVLCARWLGGEMETQLFMTNVYGAYISGEEESRHRWGYAPTSLAEFLWSNAEWSKMRPFDWRVIPGMDLARDFWIMAAEVIK